MSERSYWLETLGCPKNQVDSAKLAGTLAAEGLTPADRPDHADLVVVNTCAFIDAARRESIDTVLALHDARAPGSRLVVTGCLAERYGAELAAELTEVDLVAGFGRSLTQGWAPAASPTPQEAVPVRLGPTRSPPPPPTAASIAGPVAPPAPAFDLLELPRPDPGAPWAYLKVAEGCDRACGFCAIPSFRGPQRSRSVERILDEARQLADAGVREIVLVAQDLASWGRDRTASRNARTKARTTPVTPASPATTAPAPADTATAADTARHAPIVELTRRVSALVPRTRLLYLYPSGLTPPLIDAVLGTGVPYFDLSLQHASGPLLTRMRRWGDADRFLERIAAIRAAEPDAVFRSSFIVGYPGETEEDHDVLLQFLQAADLDWVGFFPFSPEEGTPAAGLDAPVPRGLALERLRECAELQDGITAAHRDAMVGRVVEVLVDRPGVARSVAEAPEIDGVVHVPGGLAVGSLVDVRVTSSAGVDLVAEATGARGRGVTDTAGSQTYGPGALATPANALTVARLLATPVFVALIAGRGASWTTAVVGAAVAFSDGVDGWLARRQGTTRSGAFLDPLADKAVVLAALFALSAKGVLPWAPVGLVAVREVGLVAYRSWAARRGVSIPARTSAKVKTLVQDLAIGACVLPPLAHDGVLHSGMIWAACVLTLVTGAQYMVDGRRAFGGAGRGDGRPGR